MSEQLLAAACIFSRCRVYGGSLQCTVVRCSVRRFAVECTVVCCRVYSGLLQSVQWFAAECMVVCCRVYGGSLQRVRRFAAESTAVCCRVYGGLLQSVRQFAGVYSGSLQSTIFTMENPHHLLMICFFFALNMTPRRVLHESLLSCAWWRATVHNCSLQSVWLVIAVSNHSFLLQSVQPCILAAECMSPLAAECTLYNCSSSLQSTTTQACCSV